MSTQDLIGFGKYRGKLVAQLLADRPYCRWLLQQDWFQGSHTEIYRMIVGGGVTVEDTPWHNQIQARFLSEKFQRKFVKAICKKPYPEVVDAEFEIGIFQVDVVLKTASGWLCGVEVKPAIGDDFPAILRQVHAKKPPYNRVRGYSGFERSRCIERRGLVDAVAYEDFTATTVTLEQVRKMFGEIVLVCVKDF